MHKGAILDVHIVRSLRIAIHAGRSADSARRSARRLPTGNGERGDAMVTLASVFLLVIVRTIWSLRWLRRPMVSAGYAGLEVSPDSGFPDCCREPPAHERSRSLGRLLGRAVIVGALNVGALYVRIERMGSSPKEARCLTRIWVKIKTNNNENRNPSAARR
jgi:hypothetical protein